MCLFNDIKIVLIYIMCFFFFSNQEEFLVVIDYLVLFLHEILL